jgi:hypothetical protein
MPDAHDPRISEIFYYFEEHTDIKNGRTVGRKIGVVQEILVKKLLCQEQAIRDCMVYEPRLRGRSGATHKVEFVLFRPLLVASMPAGKSVRLRPPELQVKVKKVDRERQAARICVLVGAGEQTATLTADKDFAVEALVDGQARTIFIKLVQLDGDCARLAILDGGSPLASLESKRVGAQRFSSTDQLGSGIQTIEKAKQTSLVAIDFDILYNPKMLVISEEDEPRPFRSFALLGNGVHWTDHDLSVLHTYVDFTFLVRDAAIIRYADYVRAKADERGQRFFDYFMAYFNGMTKTPADSFDVSDADFQLLRPLKGRFKDKGLRELVLMQIPEYKVAMSA